MWVTVLAPSMYRSGRPRNSGKATPSPRPGLRPFLLMPARRSVPVAHGCRCHRADAAPRFRSGRAAAAFRLAPALRAASSCAGDACPAPALASCFGGATFGCRKALT